MSSKYFIQ